MWLHLYLAGSPIVNQIETNQVSTNLLARGLFQREYLTVGYLVQLLRAAGTTVTPWAVEAMTGLPSHPTAASPVPLLARPANRRLIPATWLPVGSR
ncbi:hypothetical protein [Crossiella sp. NPDC003009]